MDNKQKGDNTDFSPEELHGYQVSALVHHKGCLGVEKYVEKP